ncbi:hypothetical protein R3W88_033225 [Solanum pinnatisectum]|uniref:Gag-asp_proteas domain-containing protein n=1 Tax=Solanum pinnatisectum TaxID=50273 RepID=A0AAV9K3S6_9SOLN|nr:hypothetical protein R3W88_033225 [Solanum pinnatisectum]
MAHMRTQIDLLTKHIVSKFEKVNVVGQPNRYEDQDIDLDEEVNYFGNQGVLQNYNSGNQDWVSGSSSKSEVEDMFAKMLQKVESTDAGVKEMKGTKHEQVLEQAGREEDEAEKVDELEDEMQGYAKFMKHLVAKKRAVSIDLTSHIHHCSVIATTSLLQKKEDLGVFTIPYTIRSIKFGKALYDLGASINLMPLAIYKQLGLEVLKPTAMRLIMADRSVKQRVGILCYVLVKVDTFIFPKKFMILDCEVDFEVPIILGRPFLGTGRALVDVE